MENKKHANVGNIFNIQTLILSLIGLGLNYFFSQLALYFSLPLYLDNIGSVLVAALTGPLPGMTVGFVSNLFNSLTDAITLYYGILTVFIAGIAAWFSYKGWLKNLKGMLAATLCFTVIGGAVGSCMTWFLYGGEIGEGISASYAYALLNLGFSEFWAQFIADILIDIPDKSITVGLVCTFLHCYPKKLYNLFAYSYIYDRSIEETKKIREGMKAHYRKTSLNTRILSLIITCMLVISISSMIVGVVLDWKNQVEIYKEQAVNVTKNIAKIIDGDKIDDYLAKSAEDLEYQKVKQELIELRDIAGSVEYLYVYKIKEDGCHVVFDLDTKEVKGDALGFIRKFDEDFSVYLEDLFAGKFVEPIVSNGQFGNLITSYYPIKNSQGETTAYACADISFSSLEYLILTYIIKMFAIQFGLAILIIAYASWYARERVVASVNEIMKQTECFDQMNPEEWLESREWKEKKEITTGDEIEELYKTICALEEKVCKNTKMLRRSEELEKINQKLALAIEKAEKASGAKSQFLSRMSHDIRTPINGIMGMAMLAQDNNNPEETNENLKKIKSSCEFLLGLVNDTLDMAKIESGKIELHLVPYSLPEFKEYLQAIVEPMCKQKGIEFVTNFTGKIKEQSVLIDRLRVNQVVFNLLSNATKFTPEGGKITLSTWIKWIDEKHIVLYGSIADTGIGMSKEFQTRMFDTFTQEEQTISPQRVGSGLGLAIVKEMMNLMGGTVEVESELNKGSVFTLSVKVEVIENIKNEEKSKVLTAKEQKQFLQDKKALVVEDHPLNMEIATKLLQKMGMRIETATNGQEAVDRVKAEQDFDVILMDIRMPVLDGIEASKRIRKLQLMDKKYIPIIAMTANAFDEDVKNCLAAGMDAHLAKPIIPKNLYQQIIKCIKREHP